MAIVDLSLLAAPADYGRVLFRDPEVGAARQPDHHHL